MGQREAAINAFILFGPIAIGFIMATLMINAVAAPVGFSVFTLLLYGVGMTLFLAAKFSLIHRGVRISFGPAHMSPWNRRAYRAG